MIRRASDSSDWNASILQLVEDVALRRASGESLPDSDVIEANPDLMPELGDRLAALRSAEQVLRMARGSSSEFSSHRSSPPEITIPGYDMRELLGRGAMGAVYRAEHTITGREVAIKVLHQAIGGRAHNQPRFDQEAAILAELRHPNIVAAQGVGVSQDRLYLVMEYVAGQPLDVYVSDRSTSVEERLRLFVPICEGVHAAHLHGVIHRDLKPSNILVDASGVPRLLDFGLAKLVHEDGDPHSPATFEQSMTLTGQFVGSLPWASPEQVEGVPSKIDLRTDVYALGVVLYQMLTRRFPYPVVGRIRDVMNHILETDAARPSTINADIPAEVETIVLRCLAKQPQRRYQSARELAVDVTRYLAGEPIEAKRDSNWFLLRKKLRRHRLAAMVGSAFLALSVLFGTVMAVMYRQKQHEAYRAQQTLGFLQSTLFQASSHRLGSEATLSQVLDHTLPAIAEQFGDEPVIEASLRYTVGSALETIWRKREAIEQLRRALDLQREHLGADHQETLRTMVLLGMVMAETSDPRAVELEREALSRRERLHGLEHELVADAKSELAYSLWHAAQPPQWSEAEALYEEALATYAKTLGEEHANIARALQSYSFMRLAQGRAEDAERLALRSLAMSQKLLGEDHQFTVECKMDLGEAMRLQGRFAEAAEYFAEAANHAARLFGKAREPLFLRQLAEAQSEGGEFAAAERTYRQVLTLLIELAAESQPAQAAVLREHGQRMRDESAAELENEGLIVALRGLREAGVGSDAIALAVDLAAHRCRQGRFDASLAYLAWAKEIAESHSGTRWPGEVEMGLSELAGATGQPDEALEHLAAAHSLLIEHLGENHRLTLEAADKLSAMRESLALNKEAIGIRQ